MLKTLNKFFKILLVIVLIITEFQFSIVKASADTTPVNVQSQLEVTLMQSIANATVVKLTWAENRVSKRGYYIQRVIDYDEFPQATSAIMIGYSVPSSTVINPRVSYPDYIYGVTTGHRYTYRIIAIDSAGNPSVYSSEVSFSPSDVAIPASLNLTTKSDSQIDLSWTYANSESYDTIIERKLDVANSTWDMLAMVPKNTLKYSDSGLTQNARYFYRIRATSNSYVLSRRFPQDTSFLGDDPIGIPAYTKITVPTELYGYAAQTTVIKLTWNNNSTGIRTIIERKKRTEQDFSVVNSVNSDIAIFLDTVEINTAYIYRIKSWDPNKNNYSDYSSEIIIVSNHIDEPTNLIATTNSDSDVELNWNDNAQGETGFEIWRKQSASGSWVNYEAVGSNVTQYVDRDASKDILYFYKIRAIIIHTGAFSAFSIEAKTWTSILKAPTELKATSTNEGNVKLTWTDNANNEIGYAIERKVDLEGSWRSLSSLPPDSVSYSDAGLTVNMRYYYRVKVYDNAFLNSYAFSDIILVSTVIPPAPANLIANVVTSTSVGLKWTYASNFETGFKVEKKLGKSGSYYITAEVGPNVTSYMDKTVSSNSKYYYRVRAANSNYYSDYSKEILVTTGTKIAYKDIKANYWAKDAIESLAGMGVFSIANGTNFYPDAKITRGEFTSYLVRAFKLKASAVGSFMDVKPNHKYYKEIMIANRMGIVTPNKVNYFYPDRFITREEMAVLIIKTLKAIDQPLPAHDIDILNAYSDKEAASSWALNSLAAVIGEKIMQGKTINGYQVIAPQTLGVRVEAVLIIFKALN